MAVAPLSESGSLTSSIWPASTALGQLGVDRQLGQDGYAVLCGDLLDPALAKDLDVLATVRALDIAVVFNDAQYRDIHHLRHLDRLAHDHGNEVLG